MPTNVYRIASVAALSLFVTALLSTVQHVTLKKPDDDVVEVLHGYFLAATGWLGPLNLCFAWYANIPFVYSVFKLTRGGPPAEKWAWAGMFFALSVFVPQYIFNLDGPSHMGYFYGPAIWLWLGGFAVILAAVYLPPGPPSQNMKA